MTLEQMITSIFRLAKPPDRFYIVLPHYSNEIRIPDDKMPSEHFSNEEQTSETCARGLVPLHVESLDESFCTVVGMLIKGKATLTVISGNGLYAELKSTCDYDVSADSWHSLVLGAAITQCGTGERFVNTSELSMNKYELKAGEWFNIQPG